MHPLSLPAVVAAAVLLTACAPAPPTVTAEPGASPAAAGSVEAPAACTPYRDATRTTLAGAPTWARFCPGRAGHTAPAEVPSDALVSHLDDLADLTVSEGTATARPGACHRWSARRYRVQIGFADGTIAEVAGLTNPGCRGRLAGTTARVSGPDGLGVYGTLMRAFGRQYADGFPAAAPDTALACPRDPREPGSVDVDGASASLDTGHHLGRRSPMLMPLTGVRGIACTWSPGASEPAVRDLTADQAERVRIGLHAISGGLVDCAGSPGAPTTTAVVEDRTGTRRAVTVIGSECDTVVRSAGGFGTGFAWLGG